MLGLWLLSPAEFALADGIFSDAFSAKSGGRGGTNIAHSDNGAVLMENPAGLVNFQSSRFFSFDQSFVVAVNHTELEGPLFVQTGPLAGAPMLADVTARFRPRPRPGPRQFRF